MVWREVDGVVKLCGVVNFSKKTDSLQIIFKKQIRSQKSPGKRIRKLGVVKFLHACAMLMQACTRVQYIYPTVKYYSSTYEIDVYIYAYIRTYVHIYIEIYVHIYI